MTEQRPERFPKRAKLEQLIVGHLIVTKAHTLPAVCLRYGLDDGEQNEAFGSKATYVSKRLGKLQTSQLLNVATEVAADFEDEQMYALLEEVRAGGTGPDLLAHHLTPALVREDWAKARSRLESDWAGAVTMAATTLDSALKHALDQRGVSFKKFDNMPALFDRVLEATDSSEWTDGFRQFLSNLRDLVEKLGRVRGGYSDAHGSGMERPIVDARQAELAVNMAGSLSLFLVQMTADHSRNQ